MRPAAHPLVGHDIIDPEFVLAQDRRNLALQHNILAEQPPLPNLARCPHAILVAFPRAVNARICSGSVGVAPVSAEHLALVFTWRAHGSQSTSGHQPACKLADPADAGLFVERWGYLPDRRAPGKGPAVMLGHGDVQPSPRHRHEAQARSRSEVNGIYTGLGAVGQPNRRRAAELGRYSLPYRGSQRFRITLSE